MENILLSICIPSYNRPKELYRLLNSIDIAEIKKIEIVICEDKSPKRTQISQIVEKFIAKTKYVVKYFENTENYGYDKNLRECIKRSNGKWIIYMGDDDLFVPKVMNKYLQFLQKNNQLGYIMRSYQTLHNDGSIEKFIYFKEEKFFNPGEKAYEILFRKSVFISGFAFKREYALKTLTNIFDGTLLYQLYILAEICMNYPSAYYNIPITQSIDGGIPYFGSSNNEKAFYTPGVITIDNSTYFIKNFFILTNYMDKKYKIHSTKNIRMDISKYSYPILSIQRSKGLKKFSNYHKKLCTLGINCTCFYYLYYFGLLLFNVKICNGFIRIIKKILGRTPSL